MFPAISTAQDQSQIIRQTGFSQGFGLQTSMNLTLKTKDGDRVSLLLDDQFSFSKSRQEKQFANSSEEFDFSISAQAASKFSLQVEGDLNEKELAAIRTLTQTLEPIVQSFFNEDGFDFERAQETLSGTLVVIQEVEVSLEETIQASLNANATSRTSVDDLEASELTDVRDLNSLIESVANSVFRPLEVEFPEDTLIQTFTEFKNFLTRQVIKILNPELPPEPEAIAEADSAGGSDQPEEVASSS